MYNVKVIFLTREEKEYKRAYTINGLDKNEKRKLITIWHSEHEIYTYETHWADEVKEIIMKVN